MAPDVAALDLTDRVVLLGVTALELDGETPAQAPTVRRRCQTHADALDDVVVGTFDEATVAKCLNRLDANDDLTRVELGDTTAVGKGRPAFELADPPTAVLDALASDDRVAAAVDALRRSD